MNKDLKYVLLIDDDDDDNFFHERAIKKADNGIPVIAKTSAKAALNHIKDAQSHQNLPGLIFLDINMPGMNGWEFLEEYNKLDKSLHNEVVIIMLTTSDSMEDRAKAKNWEFVSDYIKKPLNKQLVENILGKYFQ